MKPLKELSKPSRITALASVHTLHIETQQGSLGNVWQFTLPATFRIIRKNDFIIFAENEDGLRIAASAGLYPGCAWIHASCSRESTMPTYYDLRELKRIVFGEDRPAAQVFPVSRDHINIHPFCLHLWGPVHPEAWPLPDFTMGQGSI